MKPCVLVLAAAAWALASPAAAADSLPRYIIIVDAGSTGCRLRLFDSTQAMAEVMPSAADAPLFQIEPGLSSYVDTPANAGPSLAGLVGAAQRYVPKELQATTPMWVKATAGMRLVPSGQATAIWASVNSFLSDAKNNPFGFNSASVISGEEEALFMYLSTNYKLNSLAPSNKPQDVAGVMDMGGASMQVAFMANSDVMDHEFVFYMQGTRQSIYAKSFIQYGINNDLMRAKMATVQAAGPNATQVAFPCFNTGHSEVTRIGSVDVNFTGTSNSTACAALVKSLLHLDYECLLPPCSIAGTHMPTVSHVKRFYAVSSFYYTINSLGFDTSSGEAVLTPMQVKAATESFCALPKAQADNSTITPWKFRKIACFGGHYVHLLLTAFGIPPNSTQVSFATKVKGETADWTLGAALYETQYMPLVLPSRSCPAPPPPPTASSKTGAIFGIAGGLLAAFALGAITARCFAGRAALATQARQDAGCQLVDRA